MAMTMDPFVSITKVLKPPLFGRLSMIIEVNIGQFIHNFINGQNQICYFDVTFTCPVVGKLIGLTFGQVLPHVIDQKSNLSARKFGSTFLMLINKRFNCVINQDWMVLFVWSPVVGTVTN